MIIKRNEDFEGMVPANSIAFKFEANAMMVDILSNLIYKDKPLAVIRELSCNAYDSHIAAGNKNPFKVQVPTRLDPTFAVEDEGIGLPADKIGDIFWTYGKSTKTNDNNQIGAMGIGSKSPFAYTKSSFLVRSRYEGLETEYLCYINKQGTPDGAVTRSEPTDKPNGVRVELGVREEDIGSFQDRIVKFFKYWSVKPTLINGDDDINWLTVKPSLEGTGWYMESQESDTYSRQAKAIMGNICYPIAISAIPQPSSAMKFVAKNAFVINFKLGELAFAASREELSYDADTCKALEAGAKRVMSEFYDHLRASAQDFSGSTIDAATRFRSYISEIHDQFDNEIMQAVNFPTLKVKTLNDGVPGVLDGSFVINSESIVLETKTQTALAIYELSRMKSGSGCRLKQAREIKLTRDEKEENIITKAVTIKTRTKTVPWFPPATKAKRTIKGGTIGDFLLDGWAHQATSLRVYIPKYRSLESWKEEAGNRKLFILNDVGPRGSVGVRSYFNDYARHVRLRSLSLFVDFADSKTIPADFGKAEILELLKGTLAEGSTIIKLSEMPGFVMPKIEPAATKPKAPTQASPRGWMEVRTVSFTPWGERLDPRIANSQFTFKRLVEYGSPGYLKVDPSTLTTLYTTSCPGGMDKYLRSLLGGHQAAYAYHAGLFDAWTTKNSAGERTGLNFIVRNEDDIAALAKKGATLVNLRDFLTDTLANPDTLVVDDQLAIANAIAGSVAYKMTINGAMNPTNIKGITALKLLSDDSAFMKAAKLFGSVSTFFKNERYVALAMLSTNSARSDIVEKLFKNLFSIYPLLSHINGAGLNISSFTAYLAMEDARHAAELAAEAQAKLDAAAAVEALANVSTLETV
jgi:hypothetical protein